MDTYKVQLEEWQGPLDLLLQLIEKQEMDITNLSLAKVADQFIEYMNVKAIKPDEIADFLVIAAKLIYIKSKALLPTLSIDEDDGIDLEKQLKMYKDYLEASEKIKKILRKKKVSFAKDKFIDGILTQGFFPPKSITPKKLKTLYEMVINRIKPFVDLPKKIIERSIKLSDKIESIKKIIYKQACTSFQKLVGDSGSRTEKIVSFLAVLELVKQKIIHAEQGDLFEDITLKKIV